MQLDDYVIIATGDGSVAMYRAAPQATNEQEGFVDGFVKVLADLHKQNQLIGGGGGGSGVSGTGEGRARQKGWANQRHVGAGFFGHSLLELPYHFRIMYHHMQAFSWQIRHAGWHTAVESAVEYIGVYGAESTSMRTNSISEWLGPL